MFYKSLILAIVVLVAHKSIYCFAQQAPPSGETPQPGLPALGNFMQQFFSDYVPQPTRHYTVYGNGNGFPVDRNAGLPLPPHVMGPVQTLMSSSGPGYASIQSSPADIPWQPSSINPYTYLKGVFGLGGQQNQARSDASSQDDAVEAESEIITAEDIQDSNGDGKEFQIQSTMSF